MILFTSIYHHNQSYNVISTCSSLLRHLSVTSKYIMLSTGVSLPSVIRSSREEFLFSLYLSSSPGFKNIFPWWFTNGSPRYSNFPLTSSNTFSIVSFFDNLNFSFSSRFYLVLHASQVGFLANTSVSQPMKVPPLYNI